MDKLRCVDDVMDALSEYDDTDEWGKMYLFDNLVDVIHDLYKSDVREGHRYMEYIVLVDKNGEIPKPFTKLTLQGALSNEVHEIDVKMISRVERHKNGNLTVAVIGKRKIIKQEVKSEDGGV